MRYYNNIEWSQHKTRTPTVTVSPALPCSFVVHCVVCTCTDCSSHRPERRKKRAPFKIFLDCMHSRQIYQILSSIFKIFFITRSYSATRTPHPTNDLVCTSKHTSSDRPLVSTPNRQENKAHTPSTTYMQLEKSWKRERKDRTATQQNEYYEALTYYCTGWRTLRSPH